jgi:hypothetical protein
MSTDVLAIDEARTKFEAGARRSSEERNRELRE